LRQFGQHGTFIAYYNVAGRMVGVRLPQTNNVLARFLDVRAYVRIILFQKGEEK
jgi:hypothetical protein